MMLFGGGVINYVVKRRGREYVKGDGMFLPMAGTHNVMGEVRPEAAAAAEQPSARPSRRARAAGTG